MHSFYCSYTARLKSALQTWLYVTFRDAFVFYLHPREEFIMQDPILFWNNVALEANRLDHTGAMEAEHQRGQH